MKNDPRARGRGAVENPKNRFATIHVELDEGVEGLIHISEMSWTKKVRHPSKILNEGDQVEAVVLGIDSDRLFPIDGQHRIARSIPNTIDGPEAVVLVSDFGHDGFLIETETVGTHLRRLLSA